MLVNIALAMDCSWRQRADLVESMYTEKDIVFCRGEDSTMAARHRHGSGLAAGYIRRLGAALSGSDRRQHVCAAARHEPVRAVPWPNTHPFVTPMPQWHVRLQGLPDGITPQCACARPCAHKVALATTFIPQVLFPCIQYKDAKRFCHSFQGCHSMLFTQAWPGIEARRALQDGTVWRAVR